MLNLDFFARLVCEIMPQAWRAAGGAIDVIGDPYWGEPMFPEDHPCNHLIAPGLHWEGYFAYLPEHDEILTKYITCGYRNLDFEDD